MYMCSNGDITEIEKRPILEYRCLLTKTNSRGTLIGERVNVFTEMGALSQVNTLKYLQNFYSKKGEHDWR